MRRNVAFPGTAVVVVSAVVNVAHTASHAGQHLTGGVLPLDRAEIVEGPR